MKRFVLLIAVLVISASAGFSLFRSQTAPAVEAVRPVHGPAVRAVYATGTVEPGVMIPIALRATRRLTALSADEGLAVKKDQVLASFEDPDLRAALTELQAKADYARSEYDRQTAIFKKGYGSRQAVDKAKADMDAAGSAVENGEASLSFAQLKAPADGVVVRRDGEIGEMIPAGQAVFWMSCCGSLRITAEVDEEDIPLVKPGQKVLIRADAFPDEIFNGTVQSLTPKGDPVARSFRVRITLPADTKLMIGMTAETNIVIENIPDSLLIPSSAVQNGKVLVVKNGVLEERPVTLSVRGPDKSAVETGLSDSDLIVTDRAPDLKAGTRIRSAGGL